MRIVTTSLDASSRMVTMTSSSVMESSDGVSFVEYKQARVARQGARNREPLFLAARYLYAAFANHCIEVPVSPVQKAIAGRLLQHRQALVIASVRLHEQQVLTDGCRRRVARPEIQTRFGPVDR